MRRIPSSRLGWLLLLFVGPLLLSPGDLQAQGAGKAGVQWRSIGLQQALQEAAAQDKNVMIDFWAAHCGQCGVMTAELWDTPEGAKLAEGLIPIMIDTVTPEGKEAMRLYPLTGLPCVIFLRPDGTEIDRVEGYMQKQEFLYNVRPIKEGLDPLPGMEALLKQHPDSLQLMINLMERFMWRKRLADADTLYARILRIDSRNQKGMAERAILKMGRYQETALHNTEKTLAIWKMMADRFPGSMSIGAAVDGAWTCLANLGRYQEWLAWICPLLQKNPTQMSLQRSAVAIGFRGNYQSPCLATAARTIRSTVQGREAWYDSVAVYFEGGPKPK